MFPPFFNPFEAFSGSLEETKDVLADRFLTEEETQFFFGKVQEYNQKYFANFQYWFVVFLERVVRMENFNFYSYSPLTYWWENNQKSDKLAKKLGDQSLDSFFVMLDTFIAEDKEIGDDDRSRLQEISRICKIKAKKNWSHVANLPGMGG